MWRELSLTVLDKNHQVRQIFFTPKVFSLRYIRYIIMYFQKFIFMQPFYVHVAFCSCSFFTLMQFFKVHVAFLCSCTFFTFMQIFYIHVAFYCHVASLCSSSFSSSCGFFMFMFIYLLYFRASRFSIKMKKPVNVQGVYFFVLS